MFQLCKWFIVVLMIVRVTCQSIWQDDSWDFLLYSQRWPVSACVEWEEKAKGDVCNMPHDRHVWTVHGLWPSRLEGQGPFFCDSAIHFDIDQLAPIVDDLVARWTNIEGNTKPYSFWRHEWRKHGTCAAILPQLNSVSNYFTRGLEMNTNFDITQALTNANIVPSNVGYNLDDISSAVEKAYNVTPNIHCVVDSKSKLSLLSEIRLCFDKQLNLIHCVVNKEGCNAEKPVMYLANNATDMFYEDDSVDFFKTEINEQYRKYNDNLHTIYKILEFLIWFTL